MCGIAGFFAPAASAGEETLAACARAMAQTLFHRGPDDGGTFVDVTAGLGFGFRRLAIIDLSPAGHQPMRSADGRYAVVFNGEIYNFRALRAELEGLGHAFRGHSDTEVLLAAICQWGLPDSLRRFNGMFAFALWDTRERTLSLARDRLGEKPLYYGWSAGVFLFGSELKALRAHPSFQPAVDTGALGLYLRHNYVPSPHSIYRGISKLPPAHSLTISATRKDAPPTPYWSVGEAVTRGAADPFPGKSMGAQEELDALLRDAVKLRMEADVPLGAFLSGGIDSSVVVALMQTQSSRPIRTFSIGFHEEAYNEADHAKAVASYLGTEHTELYVRSQDALAIIPRLPSIYDEPFADSSQIPTLLVSELARKHVTVSLSGDGGDEIFGGYSRYEFAEKRWRALSLLPLGVRRAVAQTLRAEVPRSWGRLAGVLKWPGAARETRHRIAALLELSGREDVYSRMMSYWDPGAEPLISRETLSSTRLTEPHLTPTVPDFSEWMMYVDSEMYLPDDILAKVDRASMSVSLEARVPLLDHRVAEFAWRLPRAIRIGKPPGKQILRDVLSRYVPRALFERPKMGFGVPISAWLRGPLREWAENLLDERRLRDQGLLDVGSVRQRWTEHTKGAREWHYSLWGILMFEAWVDAAEAADAGGPDVPAVVA
jgi:asparagine synthase (glutamine-hydrolysing)